MFKDYQPKKEYDENFFSGDILPRSFLDPLLSSLGEMGLDQSKISHEIARKLVDASVYQVVSLVDIKHLL